MLEDCKNPKDLANHIMEFLDDPEEYLCPSTRPMVSLPGRRSLAPGYGAEGFLCDRDLQNISVIIYDRAIRTYPRFRKNNKTLPLLREIPENLTPKERLTLLADFLIGINNQKSYETKPQVENQSKRQKVKKRRTLLKNVLKALSDIDNDVPALARCKEIKDYDEYYKNHFNKEAKLDDLIQTIRNDLKYI